jgi:hypothetical protein
MPSPTCSEPLASLFARTSRRFTRPPLATFSPYHVLRSLNQQVALTDGCVTVRLSSGPHGTAVSVTSWSSFVWCNTSVSPFRETLHSSGKDTCLGLAPCDNGSLANANRRPVCSNDGFAGERLPRTEAHEAEHKSPSFRAALVRPTHLVTQSCKADTRTISGSAWNCSFNSK